jgi:hypothetical protein
MSMSMRLATRLGRIEGRLDAIDRRMIPTDRPRVRVVLVACPHASRDRDDDEPAGPPGSFLPPIVERICPDCRRSEP